MELEAAEEAPATEAPTTLPPAAEAPADAWEQVTEEAPAEQPEGQVAEEAPADQPQDDLTEAPDTEETETQQQVQEQQQQQSHETAVDVEITTEQETVIRQKKNAADAEAIVEAALRPTMRYVEPKTAKLDADGRSFEEVTVERLAREVTA